MPQTSTTSGTIDSSSKPRRRDAKSTRERLVRAALELFTTHGYHASTTPQVARRAGVAEGTIYRHFASKEQLLNEIYRGAVQMFTRIIKEASGKESCRKRLSDVATQWGDTAANDPPLVTLVFVTPPNAQLDDKSRHAREEMRIELEKLVASGKASGEVRPGPAYLWTDIWFQLVRLMLERVATREWATQHSAPRQVIESAWDAIAVASSNPQTAPQHSAASLPMGR